MEGTRATGSGPFMPRKFLKAPPRAPERTDLGVGMPVCASALQKSPSKRRTQAKREQDGLHTRTCCEPPGHAASVLKRPQAALAKSKRSAQASGIDSPKGRDGTDEAGPARCAAPEPDPLQGGDARWTTGVKEGKRRKTHCRVQDLTAGPSCNNSCLQ